MVCTKYPPIQGGIGRYVYNLVKSLRSKGIEKVLSNVLPPSLYFIF
jgi:glycosyltransferase involved in cell wall biosynthesis